VLADESESDNSSECSFSNEEVDKITIEEFSQREESSNGLASDRSHSEDTHSEKGRASAQDKKYNTPRHHPSRKINLVEYLLPEEDSGSVSEARLRSKSSNYEMVNGQLQETRREPNCETEGQAKR